MSAEVRCHAGRENAYAGACRGAQKMLRQKITDVLSPISTIVWTQLHGGEAMAERDLRVSDPAAHQPTKADMEEDVSIDATPRALAWSVTRGGAERRPDDG